jgi:hypothetical protein
MSPLQRGDFWGSLRRPPERAVTAATPEPTLAADAFEGANSQGAVEERISELVNTGSDRDEVLRAAVRKLNSPDIHRQLEDLLGEFEPLLENNPRAMKRLVNAYGIERDRLLRESILPTPADRRQLVLFIILRLRWPQLAEYLLKYPDEAKWFADGQPEADHPFHELTRDRDVRRLFDGTVVDVSLDEDVFARYAGRRVEQPPSVGA